MTGIICPGRLIKSQNNYEKKQICHFKELTKEEKSNSLEGLLEETLTVLKKSRA